MRTGKLLLITALLAACGAKETAEPQAGPSPSVAVSPASTAAAAASMDLPDPEPPDAQAKAEAVVNAEFNKNKRTSLSMNITTIVGRTSGLSGFSTAMAATEDKIDDRLARLGAKVTETEVVIQLPGSILFDFDSAKIRADAHRALTDVSEVIKAYTNRPVRVDGHTDSVASDEYNQSLSERRAQSVVDWLATSGVERGRLTPAGQGEKKPVATNDTAAGRQLNRRVEVVIAKK